jgi:hypothetical protein
VTRGDGAVNDVECHTRELRIKEWMPFGATMSFDLEKGEVVNGGESLKGKKGIRTR